jgi:hypothetical protein
MRFARLARTYARARPRYPAAHERIHDAVKPAEQVSLAPATVDLVAVAAAAHRFDLDRCYDMRVGR